MLSKLGSGMWVLSYDELICSVMDWINDKACVGAKFLTCDATRRTWNVIGIACIAFLHPVSKDWCRQTIHQD